MNLLLDRWIPARRPDGKVEKIAPWQITEGFQAVDSTKAQWNAGLTEFLVSLFQTLFIPDDAKAWRDLWNEPPQSAYLKREMEKAAPCFELFGKQPFMQDPTIREEAYRKEMQKLLVDGVSENQEKYHADLFVKSRQISVLCFPCAAAAVWDLQSHAPQGGRGNYTSLRGGKSSTTLVLADTLWHTVWANVIEQSSFDMKGRQDPKTFLPWLHLKNADVSPEDEHPLHVYWGMPRRLLLDKTEGPTVCDTCGDEVSQAVRSFFTYMGGFHYDQTQWKHPCSPYVRTKDAALCVRAARGDLAGYKHWLGLLVDTPGGNGIPAFVIKRWLERNLNKEFRIWAYGWATDQAAVTGWCEGKMPLVSMPEIVRKQYEKLIITLVTLSQRAEECLSDSLRGVLDSAEAGSRSVEPALAAFWAATEPSFLEAVRKNADNPSKAAFDTAADAWVPLVQDAALDLYERHLPKNIDPMWVARYAHKLRRRLSSRDPITLKTRLYGDWRLTDDA